MYNKIRVIGSILYISTTRQCNINCSYCHIPQKQRDTYVEDPDKLIATVKHLAEVLKKNKLRYKSIVLHGAECTTIGAKNLAELCNIIHTVADFASIQSNLVLFGDDDYREDFFNHLKEHNKVGFSTTIDGPKVIHDLNRDNSYDAVCKGVDALYNLGYKIGVLTTITKHTLDHLNEFLVWVNVFSRVFVDIKFRLVEGEDALDKRQIKKYLDFIYTNNLTRFMQTSRTNDTSNLGNKCNILEIDSNGDCYPCNQAQESLESFANIFKDDFIEILKIRQGYFFQETYLLHDDCKTCESLQYCNGGCPIYRDKNNKALDCTIKKSMTANKIDRINMNEKIIPQAAADKPTCNDECTCDHINGCVCFCISCISICDCVHISCVDVVHDITKVVYNTVDTIGKAVDDTVDTIGKAIDDTERAVGKAVSDTLDIASAAMGAMVDFGIALVTNPKILYTDQNGNFSITRLLSFAVAVGVSIITWNPTALAAWYTVSSGAINAAAQEMAKKGWITEQVAVILSFVADVALMWYGMSGLSGALSSADTWLNTYNNLTLLGISSETAIMMTDTLLQLASYTGYLQTAFSAYDIYNSYEQYLQYKAQYEAALAAFEAWWKKFQERTDKEDTFVASFINGEFMKYYPGQPMFAATMPAREYYPSVEGTQPGMVMLGDGLLNSDIFVARMTFSNPYYDFPGNSSYMNSIQDYPKFWRSSI
jgi:radical SAM protein with 4Fe4S-binding SPASM domain